MNSALYTGVLTHRRDLAPAHRFAYRMRLLWLDLDEVNALFGSASDWSARGPALGWLRRRDYLRPETASLKQAVYDEIAAQLAVLPAGPVRMLTAPRLFGIGFNPLTLYYCYGADGHTLEFVLAEVRNTPWLERHCYVLDARTVANQVPAQPASHPKAFHVSPFLPMTLQYDWQLNLPGDDLTVQIRTARDGVPVFRAVLALNKNAELTPALLQKELWQHWPQGLKTLAGIYWQALKLLARRARFYAHPGAVVLPATAARAAIETPDPHSASERVT